MNKILKFVSIGVLSIVALIISVLVFGLLLKSLARTETGATLIDFLLNQPGINLKTVTLQNKTSFTLPQGWFRGSKGKESKFIQIYNFAYSGTFEKFSIIETPRGLLDKNNQACTHEAGKEILDWYIIEAKEALGSFGSVSNDYRSYLYNFYDELEMQSINQVKGNEKDWCELIIASPKSGKPTKIISSFGSKSCVVLVYGYDETDKKLNDYELSEISSIFKQLKCTLF